VIDISGFQTGIIVVALASFPVGFSLSQFADDVDPLTVDVTETTGYEMLYDGSLFAFDKAAPIKLSVSVIPGSADDINLKILLQARKGSKSIVNLPDITSIVITYPDGGRVMLSSGTILSGPLADTIQTTGRKKGNTYSFVFGSFAGAQNPIELASTVARAALAFA
jgi:hypothetical protein